ncbi:MAG: YhcH/YjgK/YiaL family protein, partial [Opitutaceae bacterium]
AGCRTRVRGLLVRGADGEVATMALYGSIETIRAQAPRSDGFAIAFRYVDELFRPGSEIQARVRALRPGDKKKVEIGGGAFVLEETYQTKARADGFFESHRKFIDVQAIFEGEELMEVGDIARMKVRQPYNTDRDLIIYEDCPDASLLRVHAGQAAVFFPVDVHMPTLRVQATPVLVRKCVVKIPVA